ncbi:hypothetical protein D3C86_1924000 [compost metagenome]
MRMTERIDHAAESRKWLEYSANLNPEVDWPRISHAAVLAAGHAALAGVEQQRIANLITVAGLVAEGTFGDVGYDLDKLRAGVAGEVWEGLGL